MDTATQLTMVAGLARSAAGGFDAPVEVGRARPKREVVIGKGFVPEPTSTDGEFVIVNVCETSLRYDASGQLIRADDPYGDLKVAYAAGKTIEVKFCEDAEWSEWDRAILEEPSWSAPPECYRVKEASGVAARVIREGAVAMHHFNIGDEVEVEVTRVEGSVYERYRAVRRKDGWSQILCPEDFQRI